MNRTVCSALEEMRKLNKTRNYGPLAGLIEEVQSMVNRMEAALYDKNDLDRARKEYKKLKAELKELRELVDETAKRKGKGKTKTTRDRHDYPVLFEPTEY